MITRTALALRNRDTRDFEALVEIVHGDGRREVVTCGYRDTEGEALELASENIATMARRARNVAAAETLLTIADAYDAAATFAEELDDDAVYCEACGHEVNPAEAVLDGELMVCQGCAPCSVAEFEAMQQREADALAALVPDPETWQAVSEAPCEPVTPVDLNYYGNSTGGFDGGADIDPDGGDDEPEWPADAVEVISRAELFDSLCLSVDELRDYWRDVPRRLKAINEAWEVVLMAEAFYFNAQGDLLVESSSRPGTYYAVGHSCPCQAGRWGNHCRHSIVADILGRAVRIARLKAA